MSKFSFPFDDAFCVTAQMRQCFNENGFIIVRKLFKSAEVNKLVNFFESSEEIRSHAYGRDDGAERKTRVALWNHPGDDIGGMVSRCKRVAGTIRELLGGHEVYHYHSKLMMKEAEIGGQHVWHQDYGYWYKNGCLYPDMGSVFIALDACTKENGCLQVLAGSHLMGRIDHGLAKNKDVKGDGAQREADSVRVEWAKERCELVHCILEPGDAIFFHSNLLHTSAQNRSKHRRWTMIISFNQARNNPTIPHHHPQYTKLDVVEDEELMKCNNWVSTTDKWFFDPATDVSVRE